MHAITQLSGKMLVSQLVMRGFASRRVNTREGSIHYLEAKGRGSLPPLLVLHGFSAASHLYDGILLRMRRHTRRIIAPDMLGHGGSDMPASGLDDEKLRRSLLDFFDRVVTEPVIIFGNSLGGAAALTLAIERPHMIRGLFLAAPGGAAMSKEELEHFVQRFRLRTHDDALEFIDRLFQKKHPFRHALAWGTRHQFARPGLRDLLERVQPHDLLCGRELSQLPMPIEVVWGGADRILQPAHLEFFSQHLPAHARISVIDHFGHTPHMDHPRELHRRLLAFVRSVADGSAQAASANRPNFEPISSRSAA